MSRDRRIKIGLRRQYLNQVSSAMIPPYMYYQQPQFAQAPPNFNSTDIILGPDFTPLQISTTQKVSHSPYPVEVPTLISTQRRAASGAWKVPDDNRLIMARMEGLNWNQIKDAYFPSKSANACRKRHERVVQRKSTEDWDTRKLQLLAKEYMRMRKQIWSGLAARTGERWNVVEAKCAANGLKNLQSAARAASRRDRLETK
ncbi:hypothetical protein E4U22_003191 [Claviceps purpurea]|uniref:Myb-like domain-containing protein n=1 Tax=Claviceps purpurea (strain 20.1) TaxID=1111077 RepID=M1VVQ5_CLAP2|nr:hypothetical protein E4U12_000960 [Claviceps purpurea]CCE29932.1 uncharacterized protein CPUR_03779 [Claviceps purpurea 20.1]KAG6154562.1 hypothetical protein E4U37_001923 [Claviceps purpurea]KAG6162731.1 hypothetical protein E4U51_006205 [Claviceps purpurea]KAG6162945.1 hypothetical protein E4U11_002244 [Claviceps purpurea]